MRFSPPPLFVFWSHDRCTRMLFISCCNAMPLIRSCSEQTRKSDAQKPQQAPSSSSPARGWKTGCIWWETFSERCHDRCARRRQHSSTEILFSVVLRLSAMALILILFNSLCLMFNSLQRLSDWRLSKQSWVHPSLELVFCGTSPSSLWALYQFDQICSITGCKHQECFFGPSLCAGWWNLQAREH